MFDAKIIFKSMRRIVELSLELHRIFNCRMKRLQLLGIVRVEGEDV